MFFYLILSFNFIIQLFVLNSVHAQSQNKCSNLFDKAQLHSNLVWVTKSPIQINSTELIQHTLKGLTLVPEFQFIREVAEKMGVRVWLFGGTASSFLHYVKWDLARSKGLLNLQNDRFDYDYTNIFRSTQDLDIVVDGTAEIAKSFQKTLSEKFPHFLGAKAKWEVRTLRHQMGNQGEVGFKEALLNDPNFINQNSDSNSLGMVEVTTNSSDLPVRDLKNWDNTSSIFLEDTLNNQISFFRSNTHFSTSRAIAGENPEILSVIRLLVKAFQYELSISQTDFIQLKNIVDEFEPQKITNNNARRRILETSKKLILHAVNIEYAMNKLDELGLRKKIIQMDNLNQKESVAWWLNREPLRSLPIGTGHGLTAAELNIKVVAHETYNFLAYESITRSHSGWPNVLISRKNYLGESAVYGNGFYTRLGKSGARGTGLTIRFAVDPNAREGTDFNLVEDYVIFKNKKALSVIQESLVFDLNDLLRMSEANQSFQIDKSDLALLEKFKRKFNAAKIYDELNKLLNSEIEKDQDRLIFILKAIKAAGFEQIFSKDILNSVLSNLYHQVLKLKDSTTENDNIRYIKTVSSVINLLDEMGVLKSEIFYQYLKKLFIDPRLSFEIRKEAFNAIILSAEPPVSFFPHTFYAFTEVLTRILNLHIGINTDEFKIFVSEFNTWFDSTDLSKRSTKIEIEKLWSKAIKDGNISLIQSLIESGFFHINYKNISDASLLQLAVYYEQNSVIEWVISNPDFDLNKRNKFGNTEVEQINLLGKIDYVEMILKYRPDVKINNFELKERNFDGSPIVNFVKFKPGLFLKGEGEKVLTRITEPFEIMSVHLTRGVYSSVAELLKNKLDEKYYDQIGPSFLLSPLFLQPNRIFQPDGNIKIKDTPIVNVSYEDIMSWTSGLNQLSKLDDKDVQEELKKIFPGHEMGSIYRLPSTSEWEYVARLGGWAEGDYQTEYFDGLIEEYAIYNRNANNHIHPVGSKKPIFYNGMPIYDIIGNAYTWTSDLDPKSIITGVSAHAIRGGGWGSGSHDMRYGSPISYINDQDRICYFGFRLVRSVK